LLGTGDFAKCMIATSPLLNKTAPCPDVPCLFNGVHVPPIDFSASQFVGVSEYWYSSEHVFGLGGPYDFVEYERAAQKFCGREWSDIVSEHQRSLHDQHLGGDGEVMEEGQVVKTGQWGPQVEIPRLQMQCFKAAWIANVLHEGIGMPRLVDPGGNVKGVEGGDKVAEQAEEKGLGRPVFQSVDTVGDIAISWTLGKMVLEASKEVPATTGSEGPITDPIESESSSPTARPPTRPPPRPPLLDFDIIDDQVEQHLPSSLHRQSLGFSFFGFLFYAVLIVVLVFVIWRLRPFLRGVLRRVLRNRRERGFIREEYALEEGKPLTGGGIRFPQKLQSRLQRMFSSPAKRPRPAPLMSTPSFMRSQNGAPSRNSPSRSQTMPNIPQHGLNGHPQAVSSASSQRSSRASSPAHSSIFEDQMANSLVNLARSRNASQLSLAQGGGATSSLRQGLSRAAVQPAAGRSFAED
jgi:Golgi nucleoside diphosphatase